MKIFLVLLILVLSACAEVVNGWKINQAQAFCETRGGIDYLEAGNCAGCDNVMCNNGERFYIKYENGIVAEKPQ